jgi:(1->4)-alpha-D-glucan 1-alpha-D-glucosylmutase
VRRFALKVQQFTGPMMAKSLEDTAFYRYHRQLALNEVGGDPAAKALSIDAFHGMMQRRAAEWPHGMTSTATHDTKRGEDARARILALSEMPADWASAVAGWAGQNAHLVRHVEGRRLPSLGHEYMLYQALVGAWPARLDGDFTARMQAYALKAAREDKRETSWTNPNESYEQALDAFVAGLLDPKLSLDFHASFGPLAARASLLGALNGLSQLALKALLPGVPDFYQGTELWDLSLVDPDNRRPVDFAARSKALAEPWDSYAELAAHWADGRIKLALTRDLLRLRRQHPDIVQHGAYEPIEVQGIHAEHVVAFARMWQGQTMLVAVGRHFAALTNGGRAWPDSWQGNLPPNGVRSYENVLDAQVSGLELGALFRTLPVAVLIGR